MKRRPLLPGTVVLLWITVFPAVSSAADVLQNVPHDALGFVVVKNMTAADAKVEKLLKVLRIEFPAPFAFLASATGLGEGLDPQGDFLFAVLPSEDASNPQFGVWLPVRDYDRFLASLDSRQRPGIAAVVVAGEDILVARHREWVLVMDPDQRERMQQLLTAKPNPPAVLASWRKWIDENDIAVVALSDGIRAVIAWAVAAKRAPGAQPADAADDIFGQAGENDDLFVAAQADELGPGGVLASVRAALGDHITGAPKLVNWMTSAQAVGCAVRLDDLGNALTGVRVSVPDGQPATAHRAPTNEQPPTLYQGGTFVLHGSGTLPPSLTAAAAETLVRAAVDDLKSEQRLVVDASNVARLQKALQSALVEVASAAALTQPGDQAEGLYTNDFLVVHAASADSFMERADDVMRLWNTLNRDAEGDAPLIFDVEERELGKRAATRYVLDIAGAEGLAIPEVRQAMEKFFGPGGKMQLWIARVDEHNVLLAAATEAEVAAALETLASNEPADWDHAETLTANNLLPKQADWRLFFSPHAYARWHRRWKDAMTGPALGRRPAKEFSASPPIGLAGGLRNNDFWIEAAVPAQTIQSAGAYLK
jgi:hypothetical protein